MYTDDTGSTFPIEIPEPQRTELLVDWAATGLARFGRFDVVPFYETNRDRMLFHPTTRLWLEASFEAAEQAYLNCLAETAWR
jgi:hypothetical protein